MSLMPKTSSASKFSLYKNYPGYLLKMQNFGLLRFYFKINKSELGLETEFQPGEIKSQVMLLSSIANQR